MTAALNVHEQQLGELIVNFNTFFRAFAAQSASLRSDRRASCRARCRNIDRGFAALDAPSRRRRPSRTDILPGVKSDELDGRRGAAVDRTGAGLACARASSAASPRASTKRRPSLAQLHERTDPVLPADRTVQQVPDQRDLPGRQHQAPGRVEHLRRRRLQGILVQRWSGLGGARPELRRQRHDGASFLVGNGGQTLRSRAGSILGTNLKGAAACSRTRRCRRWARAPPTRPKSRRISRSCPATRRRCPNFNGPLSQGPADGSGVMTPPRRPRGRAERPRPDRALPHGVHRGRRRWS